MDTHVKLLNHIGNLIVKHHELFDWVVGLKKKQIAELLLASQDGQYVLAQVANFQT